MIFLNFIVMLLLLFQSIFFFQTVQWSLTEDFGSIIDERDITELTNNQGVITSTLHLYNLIHGQRYYFRAMSGNIKGWSEHRVSSPSSVIPSSKAHVFEERKILIRTYKCNLIYRLARYCS